MMRVYYKDIAYFTIDCKDKITISYKNLNKVLNLQNIVFN